MALTRARFYSVLSWAFSPILLAARFICALLFSFCFSAFRETIRGFVFSWDIHPLRSFSLYVSPLFTALRVFSGIVSCLLFSFRFSFVPTHLFAVFSQGPDAFPKRDPFPRRSPARPYRFLVFRFRAGRISWSTSTLVSACDVVSFVLSGCHLQKGLDIRTLP